MIARLPGGVELAYDESGSGTALLFLHGWPHDRSLWAAQLNGLSMQARCLAPDLRGFGGSTVSEPFTMEQYADDVAAFLDALGLSSAVVCGLSMGGYVALALWRRHRLRVRGLILSDTRATADDEQARLKRERLIELARVKGMATLAEMQLATMLGETTRSVRPVLCETMRRLMAAAPVEGAIGAQRAMIARPDSTSVLGTIDVPTLVVGGMEDTITAPDELRDLAAAIPHCALQLIPGAGHASAFERPAAFNHVVIEFLRAIEHPS